jgi:hypothetical protein
MSSPAPYVAPDLTDMLAGASTPGAVRWTHSGLEQEWTTPIYAPGDFGRPRYVQTEWRKVPTVSETTTPVESKISPSETAEGA